MKATRLIIHSRSSPGGHKRRLWRGAPGPDDRLGGEWQLSPMARRKGLGQAAGLREAPDSRADSRPQAAAAHHTALLRVRGPGRRLLRHQLLETGRRADAA